MVQYARVHGGCKLCTEGSCKLHGTGVPYNVRMEHCKELGIWDQEYEDKMTELRLYKKGYVKKPQWLEEWERSLEEEMLATPPPGDDAAASDLSLLSIE